MVAYRDSSYTSWCYGRRLARTLIESTIKCRIGLLTTWNSVLSKVGVTSTRPSLSELCNSSMLDYVHVYTRTVYPSSATAIDELIHIVDAIFSYWTVNGRLKFVSQKLCCEFEACRPTTCVKWMTIDVVRWLSSSLGLTQRTIARTVSSELHRFLPRDAVPARYMP